MRPHRSRQPRLSRWQATATTFAILSVASCNGDTVDPPTTGAIQASVSTTGSDLDPDGYNVVLDGASEQAVGLDGSVTFSNLQPGDHTVELQGLAANCTVTGGSSRSLTVVAGEVTQTALQVVCATLGGSLHITTATTGDAIDPDGYTYSVDGGTAQAIGVNHTVSLQIPSGDHSIELQGVAANCTVADSNPRTVTVSATTAVETTFEVSCTTIVAELEVVTVTAGNDLDPNGYAFTIDGLNSTVIGINDSVTVEAAAGNRSVELTSLANNCTVSGANPRTVTVPATGSARTEFVVGCTSDTGSLVVTTTTSGVDVDPDGYTVTVDGAIFQPIGITATVSINDIPAGDRSVELVGFAGNCTVSGDNPRTVAVPNGAAVQTDFAITCAPITGTVDVVTSTTGVDIDPNGYTVRIDGVSDNAVGVNDTVSVSGVVWGDRSVELLNLESNCTVSGDNPRTVTVPQNSPVETTFDVTCVSLTGNLNVTASTTGSDLDPDGYTVSVDGGPGEPLDTNGTISFSDVATGTRSLLLSGIAANCTVSGDNPASVSVPTVGAASHTFDVTCAGLGGSVEVTTSTTGDDVDPDGYTVTVEGATPAAIGVNATETVAGVAEGDRTVELSGIASNCSVSGDNPRTVTVTSGETVSTTFTVTCSVPLSNKIVFDTNRDGNTEIYVMTPSGTELQRLTNQAERDAEPHVSPNGARIVFTSERDGNREIYVMNSDGTDQTRLTTDAAKDAQPAWSPDGTQIVFVSERDGNAEVYVMDADGSNLTRLTNDAGEDGLPDWSPDGTKIAFYSTRGGTGDDIWIMDADGSNPVQITSNAGDDFAPAWSPDGTQIAFTSEQDPDGDREIYVMSANGTGQTRLTDNTSTDLAPQWSPDGSQLAFTSSRDGNNEVYVMNANGSGQTNITNHAATDFEVSWSP